MKDELLKRAIIEELEKLVMKRFKNKNELHNYIKTRFVDFIVEGIYESDIDDIDTDYRFVSSLQNMDLDILCDIDIYYLKTRANEIYITEVGYDFE